MIIAQYEIKKICTSRQRVIVEPVVPYKRQIIPIVTTPARRENLGYCKGRKNVVL